MILHDVKIMSLEAENHDGCFNNSGVVGSVGSE